jgi:hypothetical protein
VLVTSHVLAGAVIGSAARRHPLVAFAAGAGSHLAMDACPHWAPQGKGFSDEFLRVARCDGCAGLAAMAVAAGLAPREAQLATLAGMSGAAVFDLDKPCQYFFGFNPFPNWFQRFHNGIQREAPHRMPHELAAAAGLALLAFAALRGVR